MPNDQGKSPSDGASRRDFIRAAGGAAAAAATARLLASRAVYAQESGLLRVGICGCGGRGTGAVRQALLADENTKLVAMGDAFADHLEKAYTTLAKSDVGPRVAVDEAHKFVGLDCIKGVVDSCDVLVMAEPPGFRPRNLRLAVEAGKHLFVEKPVAVDPPGVRSILESCAMAREKKLCVVSGLCYRYEYGKQEVIKRIHDGAVGDIMTLQTSYCGTGLWHRGDNPEWTPMEYQVRNWYYFDWLSGDHIVEQHVHSLDKIAWAMKDEYPVRVYASGGRAQRTDPKFGNVWDHFNAEFEYANGVKLFSACRQWNNTDGDVSDHVYGTKGVAHIQTNEIAFRDGTTWKHERTGPDDMYQNEHNALFAAIRRGEPINNGDYMAKSTMMAIAARMSAYTGQALTWDEAVNLPLDLTPARLEWGDCPVRPLPVPGEMKQT
jgi:predicted dehydrogenase